MVAVV
ncbi:hypothetical protein VCHE40_3225A, partial [Vibrio cholerae HE-40]|jgi:hypothetical protein